MIYFLLICNFASGVEYYSTGPKLIYGGHQYRTGILNSIDGLDFGYSLSGDFEASNFNINFVDEFFAIRNRENSDILNQSVEVYLYNGSTATKAIEASILKVSRNMNGIATLNCSSVVATINDNYMYTINSSEFPNAPAESLGKVICDWGGMGDVSFPYHLHGQAWKVSLSSTKDYITGKQPTLGDAASTLFYFPYKVYDGAVDVTASCSFTTDTITIEGVQYKRQFIDYNSGSNNPLTFCWAESLAIDVTKVLERLIEKIPGLSSDSSNLSDLNDFLEKRMYWADIGSGNVLTWLRYVYNYQLSGIEIFQDFCDSTNTKYYIDEGTLYFSWIDYSEITGNQVTTWEQSAIDEINYEQDHEWIKNEIQVYYYHDGENGYDSTRAPEFYDNIANRAQNGTKKDSLYAKFLYDNTYYLGARNEELQARTTAKHYLIQRNQEKTSVNVKINAENTISIKPGDIIRIRHQDLVTTDYRYHVVERYNLIDSFTYDVNLMDIEYLRTLDTNCKLSIHSWIDDYNGIWNDAPDSDSWIVIQGLVTHQTQAGSLGGCMMEGDGSSRYLKIDYDAEKWDMLQFTDYTVFFEVKFNNAPTSNEIFFNNYETLNNDEWIIFFRSSDKTIKLLIYEGSSTILNITSNANAITDTNIHQVAVIKVGSDFGIYVDGTQIGYGSSSATNSIDGVLYMMARGDISAYLDGLIGETYIGASNIFSAAPDAGLTDTITVKTNPFDWYGLNE